MTPSRISRSLTPLLLGLGAACNTARDASADKSLYDSHGDKIDESQTNSDLPAWRPLQPSDGLTAIGALGVALGIVDPDVCTTFLIDTGVPSAPAYALTNGHCNFFQHFGFDPLKATEFRLHQATDYFAVLNHYVSVPENDRVKIPFKDLTYVTESDVDVAIFATTKTIAEVKAMGYSPLHLSPVRPYVGQNIRLIGIPLRTAAYDHQSLYVSSCKVGDEVSLRNGIYAAPHSVKHKCSSIPGFSGGPLVADDGMVVLLNSHGTDDFSNDPACTYESMPCEIRASGELVVDKTTNYAQYVDGIAGCFNAAGLFDLTGPHCTLQGGAGHH